MKQLDKNITGEYNISSHDFLCAEVSVARASVDALDSEAQYVDIPASYMMHVEQQNSIRSSEINSKLVENARNMIQSIFRLR